MTKFLLKGGPLFDGYRLYESGSVLIEGDVVADVFHSDADIRDVRLIETGGDLIMPGLVDLHSDSLERSIEKRKGVYFDPDFAILNLDRQLASCGITSFCHAVSFADGEFGLRKPEEAENCIRKIVEFNRSGQSLVNHLTHVRYEVGSPKSFDSIIKLINEGIVDILSIMDHTPGQGQFKTMASYVTFQSTEYGLSQDEILEKAAEKQAENDRAWQMVKELTHIAGQAGIPILSHDDDTHAKIDLIQRLGVTACEFPVTLEAAAKASQTGMNVFMGAPNLIRNQSTNGNLKASDTILEGLCTGLVSDYYPESLFQAAFMASRFSSDEANALQMVTSNPGRFLNTTPPTGIIEKGAYADIVVINRDFQWAHITHSFVRGKCIYKTEAPQTL